MNIEILKYLAQVKHASVSLATVLPPKSGSLGTSSICSACTPQMVNRTFHVQVIHIATYMNYDISSQALLFSFKKKRGKEKQLFGLVHRKLSGCTQQMSLFKNQTRISIFHDSYRIRLLPFGSKIPPKMHVLKTSSPADCITRI